MFAKENRGDKKSSKTKTTKSARKDDLKITTRENILRQAKNLFNEKGTTSISTNHICEACGISAGNLYYYFKNKNEIICELFMEMTQNWDEMEFEPPSREAFFSLFERMFLFLWEYRFLHRDAGTLIRDSDEFKKLFETAQKKRLHEIDSLIKIYKKGKIIKPLSNAESDSFQKLIWFFSLHWISFLETQNHKVTQKNVNRGMEILKMSFQSFLNESEETPAT